MDENAAQTVKKWKFLPAMKAGSRLPYKSMVEVSFRFLLSISFTADSHEPAARHGE